MTTGGAPPSERPIVFVVDDDISVRESLEMLIRCAGWHPEVFASAQDFLTRAPPASPHCLVLDITLPDQDGLDLTRLIAHRTATPIIFISGRSDGLASARTLEAAPVEVLEKPFNYDAMLDAIQRAIARSKAALDGS